MQIVFYIAIILVCILIDHQIKCGQWKSTWINVMSCKFDYNQISYDDIYFIACNLFGSLPNTNESQTITPSELLI